MARWSISTRTSVRTWPLASTTPTSTRRCPRGTLATATCPTTSSTSSRGNHVVNVVIHHCGRWLSWPVTHPQNPSPSLCFLSHWSQGVVNCDHIHNCDHRVSDHIGHNSSIFRCGSWWLVSATITLITIPIVVVTNVVNVTGCLSRLQSMASFSPIQQEIATRGRRKTWYSKI